jgi:preprotein translocase subunit YajC
MISSAFAQAPAGGGADGGMMNILFIVLMFVIIYFLMIRPQMKRAKEHRTMLDALQKGDEVITAGGVLGRVSKMGDAYVTIEIAPNTEVSVQKAAVQTVLPKGTLKSIQS